MKKPAYKLSPSNFKTSTDYANAIKERHIIEERIRCREIVKDVNGTMFAGENAEGEFI